MKTSEIDNSKTDKNTHPDTGRNVTIYLNGESFEVHRGHQSVADIKAAVGIHPSWDLVLVEDGRMKTLPDDGFIVLKGGEQFIGHAKCGASS